MLYLRRINFYLCDMMKKIIYMYYDSPCGRLVLGDAGGCLCLCDWCYGRRREIVDKRLERMLGAVLEEGRSDLLDSAARQLDDFFAGKRRSFSIPLHAAGTDFQRRVWDALQSIPYGTTISYAQLAREVGRPSAVRAIAGAVGANPMSIFVPCHRVIGSDGALTGYAGGLEAKHFLLELEKTKK